MTGSTLKSEEQLLVKEELQQAQFQKRLQLSTQNRFRRPGISQLAGLGQYSFRSFTAWGKAKGKGFKPSFNRSFGASHYGSGKGGRGKGCPQFGMVPHSTLPFFTQVQVGLVEGATSPKRSNQMDSRRHWLRVQATAPRYAKFKLTPSSNFKFNDCFDFDSGVPRLGSSQRSEGTEHKRNFALVCNNQKRT